MHTFCPRSTHPLCCSYTPGSCLASSHLLLACESLASRPPASGYVQCTEISRILPWQSQHPALLCLHHTTFPFVDSPLSHPMASHFHVSQQLWCQQWSWLTLKCKGQERSFQPGWEMAAPARTFVGCNFAWRRLKAQSSPLCLLAGEGENLDWHNMEILARRDRRSCPLFSVLQDS